MTKKKKPEPIPKELERFVAIPKGITVKKPDKNRVKINE